MLDGQVREVRCQVRSISGFSGHADETELLDWLAAVRRGQAAAARGIPRRVFLVHGDPEAQVALEPKVQALGFATHVPYWHERSSWTDADMGRCASHRPTGGLVSRAIGRSSYLEDGHGLIWAYQRPMPRHGRRP